MSVWQTPHAANRTSTSPSRGSASSTSCTTSGLANSSRTAALILICRSSLGYARQQPLLARERLARRREDLHLRELARGRETAEVHDLVVPGAPAQAIRIR